MATIALWEDEGDAYYVEGQVIYWSVANLPVPFAHAFVVRDLRGSFSIVDPSDIPELPRPIAYLAPLVWAGEEAYRLLAEDGALPLFPRSSTTAALMAVARGTAWRIAAEVAGTLQPGARTARGANPGASF